LNFWVCRFLSLYLTEHALWELAEARKRDALYRARGCGEEPPAELLAEEGDTYSSIQADVGIIRIRRPTENTCWYAGVETQLHTGTAIRSWSFGKLSSIAST